uniref:Uncharacterized protein n=1 Tax=Mesocestoides corti TaxID=53468 RepID=A0A5K3ERY0_MESCO
MAYEEDMQPTREGHEWGAACNEQRCQRGGLGWTASDVWFWLVTGLHTRARVFYTITLFSSRSLFAVGDACHYPIYRFHFLP